MEISYLGPDMTSIYFLMFSNPRLSKNSNLSKSDLSRLVVLLNIILFGSQY